MGHSHPGPRHALCRSRSPSHPIVNHHISPQAHRNRSHPRKHVVFHFLQDSARPSCRIYSAAYRRETIDSVSPNSRHAVLRLRQSQLRDFMHRLCARFAPKQPNRASSNSPPPPSSIILNSRVYLLLRFLFSCHFKFRHRPQQDGSLLRKRRIAFVSLLRSICRQRLGRLHR